MTDGPGSVLNFWQCTNETIRTQNGTRVRRASRFQNFDGQSWTQNRGTNPIPLQSIVQTKSPARIARLLITAYRTRQRPITSIARVGRAQRVFLCPKNRRDIVVEERSRRSDGRRPQFEGQTSCLLRTVYRNRICSPDQIEMALRDICRVQDGVDSDLFTFAGQVSGCEDCNSDNLGEQTPRCKSCCKLQCSKRPSRRLMPVSPAGDNTSLTEDDITKIMRWYTTGVSFVPPAEDS